MKRQLFLASILLTLGAVVGCGGSDTPTAPTQQPPPPPPPPAFTVTVSSTAPFAFYPMFGSSGTTATVTAQRSPAGALTGGWSSPVSLVTLQQTDTTAVAMPVGAGDATITYADSTGPSGSTVIRSAPKFDSNFPFGGNTVVANCVDTTPQGTFTFGPTAICNFPGVGLGQAPYRFDVESTAASNATPVVVLLTGSFKDSTVFPTLTISNAPTISAAGTFTALGTGNSIMSTVPVALLQTWDVTAARTDSITGTSTLIITPSGNRCGSARNTECTGNVTITRTIQTAQRQ